MKIYDKEALFMVLLDFAILAYALAHIIRREVEIHHIAILLFASADLKTNIIATFSEEGSKKRKKQVEKEKQAYKNVFGRFAPLAPFGFFICLGIGLLLLKLLPGRMLGVYVIICGFFAPLFERIIIGDEMVRMEKEQE